MKYKPQRRRLIQIDLALSAGRYPNCVELAQELEVSSKTIQRDIEFLRDTEKAPIEYSHAENGYYYTEEHYSLPAIELNESDLFSICIAEQALTQYEGTPLHKKLSKVFEKIENSLPETVTLNPAWISGHVSFKDGPHRQIKPEVWDVVAQGLAKKRGLLIRHRSPNKPGSTTRRVDPYHLMHHNGDWYLIGHCRKQEAIRIFAVSRIQHVELLRHRVEVPEEFDALKLFEKNFGIIWSDKEHRVRLRFDKEATPYIKERVWQKGQELIEKRGGGVELIFTTSHLAEITTWILSWGRHVKVLAPKELVERVAEDLKKAAGQYGG